MSKIKYSRTQDKVLAANNTSLNGMISDTWFARAGALELRFLMIIRRQYDKGHQVIVT